MHYDAIIVGSSYAGLAAATQLARARRRILVVDGGRRRNRQAERSHGFLTQDGAQAAAIAAKGREQLLTYDTVRWIDGTATGAWRNDAGFQVQVDGAAPQNARTLILATGVVDRLPDLPGLPERWGRHVFHCPYCHGYELGQGEIGVLATSALSMHAALMLPDWGRTTLFLNGAFEPDGQQSAQLAARGVRVERSLVDRIEGRLDLILRNGHVVRLDGLFISTWTEVASPLAAQLGCAFEEGPLGRFIKTDAAKEASVPGIFACGDAARQPHNLSFAVSDGVQAGVSAHRTLIFGGH